MIRIGRHFVSPLARAEGGFLELALPVVAFATLTTDRKNSRAQFDHTFRRWIDVMQAEERLTLGWFRSYERAPSLHAHAGIVAAAPIDCSRSEKLWMQVSGSRRLDAAQVKQFEQLIYGGAYILKSLDDEHEDIAFSANLAAFAPASDDQFFGRHAKQRRTRARIIKQALLKFQLQGDR